ncbi:methyltransferase [Bordetella petrii]|uniref:Methylase n=1 Tax=Bordetella petrii (strain ATCC BAA-461 / DSM 12804 / CCUG 43448 / CIP 107267 / Se-1111R) TaxID=340100 RepID=A9I0A7_BORPD|nr:class I SAM-dependent methyltransferase [Bordetella petrii]CAP44032.1 putative methylase [Bordetella petrii]
MPPLPTVHWTESGQAHHALWRSESAAPPPARIQAADDRMPADVAYRLICEGTHLLWRGDFQNARQLLQALARRIDKKSRKPAASPLDAFNRHRQAQSQRARLLGSVLLPFDADHAIPLRRAPDARQACLQAYGPAPGPYLASLRELQGVIGAHEWRKKGVPIAALNDRIHPHYGVFSPVRGEYIDLVARAPLPGGQPALAYDIGTGTGVLAAVLARRGVRRIVATDQDPRALACARENLARLGLHESVELMQADLFPDGRADLVVCNPPWLPARPSAPVEYAIYDPDSRMLRGFLQGLAAHLAPGGEGWLIMSDLAEHLGLRAPGELAGWITAAGLRVAGRLDARPLHPRASDPTDPLHAARAAEITSLWRLAAAS